ncbi:MAG: Asp-tRNA(Asn)/Glu-tRNA(Gln) amidotransferase GatCAB subunit B, partial [Proteobacteria bacterium]|nr:Asp-tRNA(Asn)/Glu-tRNA(Gln) amidotransferase GatCAB subunit B [Pseudomonadota bacterium]
GTISGRMAKDVFEEMMATGKDAADIVEEQGLEQITDGAEIEAAVDKVIAENPDQAADVRDGKEKTIGWFVGQVMQATGGKANPKMVNELLRKKLSG